MKEKTYTLNIRQIGLYQFEVTIPETVGTKMAATLDSVLNITLHDILKHLTTRSLILVFAQQHTDRDSWSVDPQVRRQTDLEHQVSFGVVQLGIAPQMKRREHHLVLELSYPLTREQAAWIDAHVRKLFDKYYIKDELEVELDAVREEAHDNQKVAAHE